MKRNWTIIGVADVAQSHSNGISCSLAFPKQFLRMITPGNC
jgi:hypothetical protein